MFQSEKEIFTADIKIKIEKNYLENNFLKKKLWNCQKNLIKMSPALRRSGDKKSWTMISVFLCLLFTIVQCFPDPGKFTIHMDSSKSYAGIVKNMYNGTKIFIKVECDPKSPVRKYHFILFFQIVRKSRCHHVHFI